MKISILVYFRRKLLHNYPDLFAVVPRVGEFVRLEEGTFRVDTVEHVAAYDKVQPSVHLYVSEVPVETP